ncbi:hypothetical protein ACTA71_004312 [Dictyostelium dimigraforme]
MGDKDENKWVFKSKRGTGILSLYCMLTLVEKGRTLIELHGLIICKKVSYWVNWLYVGIVIFFVLYTCEARRQYGEQINIYEIYGIVCLVGPRIIMDQNSFFNYLEELSRMVLSEKMLSCGEKSKYLQEIKLTFMSHWIGFFIIYLRFRYISSWNRGDAFVIFNEIILTKVQVNFIFLIIGISCIIQSLYLTQINEKLQQNLMMKTGLLSKDAVVGLIVILIVDFIIGIGLLRPLLYHPSQFIRA